jgi:hypothetical protein
MRVLYKIYKYLTGNKPIFHLILPDDNGKPIIIKKNVKFKSIPMVDDKIYFNENGPYYMVCNITHHLTTFHVIWISVIKIN